MLTLTSLINCYLRHQDFTPFVRGSGTNVCSNGTQLLDLIQSTIPALTPAMYKGQCGRIGVIGGCKEYTGAPYFGAISALKLGADLSHVFCTEGAAPVIKSYSPELIVHPILDSVNGVEEACQWLPRMHSLVIGPGLGRDPRLLANVKSIIARACELSLPMVIDADGVFLLSQEPGIIRDYPKAVLTPNAVEFSMLFEAVLGGTPDTEDMASSVARLSVALGHVTIVRKGQEDIIANGKNTLVCSAAGNPRRCGGQGDLLAGSMGVFTYWAHKAATDNERFVEFTPTLCAAYAACVLTRECGRRAYLQYGRSTMTSNMIDQIQGVFEDLYG